MTVADVLDGLGGAPARPGVVHLVGGGRRAAGCGATEPSLLTLRAAVLAASVDHVVVEPWADQALCRLVRDGATVEERSTSGLAGSLPPGSVLVVLSDDPSLPHGQALAGELRDAGREVEVVPAVGYVRAATAAAGVGLGRLRPGDDVETIAVETGDLRRLAGDLAAAGWTDETPALVITQAGRPRQRTVATTVGGLVEHQADGGTVVVVGTVARVPWRDELPLAGVSVLVPRSRAQASALSMHVRSLGGEAVEAPTITIEEGDLAALDDAVRELATGRFVGVCLTSPNGADALADAVVRVGLDGRALAAAGTVAAVGPGTAVRLWDRLHVAADLVPETSTSAALAEAYPAGSGQVLLPRADIATETLAVGLRHKGYEPVEIAAYVTGRPDGFPEEVAARLESGDIDLVAFASSSTARNFLDLVGDRPWHADVVSIGPVTSQTCRELGLTVAVEAEPHDLDGLVAALCEAARRRR